MLRNEDDPTQDRAPWSLAEPVRRALYRWVHAQPREVNRTEAAEALELPPHVAKFHLDRLEADGLLDVRYRRPEGRGGPGAGRPAKWYRSRDVEVSVSVPERHYDLAGDILATGIEAAAASGGDIKGAVVAAATVRGRQLGDGTRHTCDALLAGGYEPRAEGREVVLENCPFHSLATRHTGLVCAANHALIGGLLDVAEDGDDYRAHLRPSPGRCCVVLERTGASEDDALG
jgi:predicted ArsR family transcriptional regulator